ncbi:MAG: hypothetical protein HOE90_03365 [Bacteriovoracaceae bacterium]|nr:hypothetical protein [Bacteriovoracaceae bacterium]
MARFVFLIVSTLFFTNVYADACYDHFYKGKENTENTRQRVKKCRHLVIVCDDMNDIEEGKASCLEMMGEMSKLDVGPSAMLDVLNQSWRDLDEWFIRKQAEDEIKRLEGERVRREMLGQ